MKHRFFLKLLFSFLAAGLLPAVLLATAVSLILVDRLRVNLEEQAASAMDRLASGIEAELYRALTLVETVADSSQTESLVDTLTRPGPTQLSALSRRLADTRRDDGGVELHVASEGFAYFATSRNFPEVHRPDRYSRWGLLQKASRTRGETVFFPTRIQNPDGTSVILSAARYRQGTAQSLWVIADLSREGLYRRSGLAGQTLFQEVVLVDHQGTVIFDLKDPAKEDGEWWRRFPAESETTLGPGGLTLTRPLAHGFALEATLPLDQFAVMTRFLQTGSALAAGLSLLVSLGLAWALSRSVSRPVSQLVESMARVEAGDFSPRLVSRRHDELGEAFHRFNVMVDRLIGLMEQTKEEQRLLRISESKALQAQINPHFLYNTLNSIKALATQHEAEDIRSLVVRLGKLLRSTIDNRAESETVAECLDLLRHYLEIENLRFGGKFTFVVEVSPELLALPIPRLLLQPLVENALVHGLESKRGAGTVALRGSQEGEMVRFEVSDDGIGIAPSRLEALRRSLDDGADPGSHVGLRNVHRRLVLLFGERAGLSLQSEEGRGTTVVLQWRGGSRC